MAWVFRTYSCDGGGEGEPHQFEVMLASGEHPKFCPQCGCEVDAEALPVPSKIAIGGTANGTAPDLTYRLVEESSEARAKMLADESGLQGAARTDFISKFKVTDLNDGLRHGDVAAKAPSNAVTRFAQETKDNLGVNYLAWGGGMGGARVGPPIASGTPGQSFAGPGHVALAALQPEHENRVRDMVSHPTHKPHNGG